MKYYLVVCVAALSGPVFAGGPVEPAAEPPVAATAAPDAFSWTGPYVGLSAVNGTLNNGTTDFDTSGYGLQVGYLRDLGTVVVGGELAYSKGDFGDLAPGSDWNATRLKLIGGYDAGRFLPYAFVGLSKFDIDEGGTVSDQMTNYGLGARFAMGATGKLVLGLEYLVESKDSFGETVTDIDNSDLSLRLDYRF